MSIIIKKYISTFRGSFNYNVEIINKLRNWKKKKKRIFKLIIVYQERMYELERRDAELALEEKRQLEAKRALVQEATRKQDEPVDDSKLVEAMFDFLPDSSSEAPAPKDTSVFSDLPQQRADQQEVNTLS